MATHQQRTPAGARGPASRPAGSPRVSATSGRQPTPPIRFSDDLDSKAATKSLAEARRRTMQRRKRGCCSPRSRAASAAGGGLIASLTNFVFKIGVFYVVIGALWHCSPKPLTFEYSPNDPRAVCRNLYIAKAHIQPHLHTLHAQVQPHLEPYIAPIRPYAQRAYKTAAPIYNDLEKRIPLIWKRYGEPKRRQAEQAARKWADPHIKRARKEWKRNVQPKIDRAHKTAKPYHDTYKRDVHPHVLSAYALSSDVTSKAIQFYFAHVQPNLIRASKIAYKFYKTHILPYLRRAYSLNVRPTVDKALGKVFERKVGEARKDALKEAKREAEEAREAAVSKAASESASKIASVIQAQETPSYLDQAKQAVFGKEDPEEALRIAKLDAELDAETASVRSDLSAWERQHVKLVQEQYRLALQRVADLRNHALVDLPDRFALLSQDVVQGEVQNVLARLERESDKLLSDLDERSTAEKVAAFNALVDREIEALRESQQAKDGELQAFYVNVASQELDAADAAVKELDLFTVDAKRAYDALMDKVKFEAVVEEFAGWDDELVLRSTLLRSELVDVLKGERKPNLSFGAVDLSAEPRIDVEIGKLRKQTDAIFDAAIKEIRSYGDSAVLQLRGDGVRKQVQAVTGSIAESASSISSDISAGLSEAIHAAKVKLNLAEDPSLLSSMSKSASKAASAASSAAAALSSGVAEQADAADKAARAAAGSAAEAVRSGSSAASSGIRSAASAVGASVTPETPREYVASVAADGSAGLSSAVGYVADAVQDAGASASSALHRASRSAASAVGASVTPETPGEYLEAAQSGATSVARAASSGLAAGVEAVQSGAGAAYASVASYAADASAAVSSRAAAAGSEAGSLLHQATRSASSALGATPSPETPREYAEQLADRAQAAYEGASSYVVDAAGGAYSAASQAAEGAYAAASDAADGAASALHTATRSASKAAGFTPSPENVQERIASATQEAVDAVQSMLDALRVHHDEL